MRDFIYSIMTDRRSDWIARLIRGPLFIASLLYGLSVQAILACYASGIFRRKHLSVPVISVGNLTLGGTGKSPMVIYIVRMLKSKGFKVVILTRGYMTRNQKDQSTESDEVRVFRQVLGDDIPIVVNSDRYRGGLDAIKLYKPDIIVLDDGFQHWRLFRNLDIVLVDARNPFGNEALLPRGILREPVPSLKRADILVLTKTGRGEVEELKKRLKGITSIPIVETAHRPVALINIFTAQSVPMANLTRPVVAFCGIGDPSSFKDTLDALNIKSKEFISFGDHHGYNSEDMIYLKNLCEAKQIFTLVTTQKDAVKLRAFKDFWQGFEIYSLNIEIEITQGQHAFVDRINHLLHG